MTRREVKTIDTLLSGNPGESKRDTADVLRAALVAWLRWHAPSVEERESAPAECRPLLDAMARASGAQAIARLACEIEAAPGDWYVCDPVDGLDRYRTSDEAKARAEQIMEEESDRAADGWHENINMLEWGVLIPYERACCVKTEKAPEDSDFDEIQEWALRGVR